MTHCLAIHAFPHNCASLTQQIYIIAVVSPRKLQQLGGQTSSKHPAQIPSATGVCVFVRAHASVRLCVSICECTWAHVRGCAWVCLHASACLCLCVRASACDHRCKHVHEQLQGKHDGKPEVHVAKQFYRRGRRLERRFTNVRQEIQRDQPRHKTLYSI